MFVLTFSPLGEKVNTIMVLIHQPVKKSTLGKIVKNCQKDKYKVWVPKLSAKKIAQITGIFGPKTPFLALLGEIC